MPASELEGILNSHAFLRVERPPMLWETEVDLEAFIRALGEMIAAGLARNGQELSEITLNVSNVTVEPETAGPMPAGGFVAVTIRSGGDWSPETTWDPAASHDGSHDGSLVGHDLETALTTASAAWTYTRELGVDAGSVTAFYPRRTAKRSGR
jgi:hypothetical protein